MLQQTIIHVDVLAGVPAEGFLLTHAPAASGAGGTKA